MKICFILPAISRVPIGGYKMVYEYANRFANGQNKVLLLFMNQDALKQYRLPGLIRKTFSNIETQIEPRWFRLNKNILKLSTNNKEWLNCVSGTEVVIATAVETINMIEDYFGDAKKIYFIQDYENWNVGDKTVRETYARGYTNIVISQWLKEIVDKNSQRPAILIKNPIDLNIYKILTPLDTRKAHTISLLYHEKPHKGIKYALAALKKLHKLYPDLEVYMFGVFEYKDDSLPWIHYLRRASQRQTVDIYNKTRVFLCATIEEGYGLTGLEAIACGNVLVSTNYRGVREYAKDGYNALLSPVKDVDALVENVQRVFEDDKLRKALVQNGQESVRGFSWEIAYNKFKNIIQ